MGPVETPEVPAKSAVHTSKPTRMIAINVETKIGMGDEGEQGKTNKKGRRSSVSDGPNEADARPVAIPFNRTSGSRRRRRRGGTRERATVRKELDRDSRPSAERVTREKLHDH